MLVLVKNGEVYAPAYRGKKDLLICMDKIVSLYPNGGFVLKEIPDTVQIIDADKLIVVPGFIDQHMHFLGGGGKLGYYSRAGMVQYKDIIRFGVTTAISSLGVDSYLKSVSELLIRARELESHGLSTYILTGGFLIPPKSITDSIYNDLLYIDKVVGVGEIGLSDGYSSQPTAEEIIRIAANTKAAGAMSEKAGLVLIHIGSGEKGLDLIRKVIKETDLSIEQFIITHVNRSMHLLEEAIDFARSGGKIDITTGISPELGIEGSISPSDALKFVIENSASIKNVTLSSDSGGFRSVDDKNQKIESVLLSAETLLKTIKQCVKEENIEMSEALQTITSNVAENWKFKKKGQINPTMDADLVFLDHDFNIKRVMSRGEIVFES